MRFFAMLVQPRATMRRILAAPPDRAVIPLVLLAAFSSVLRDSSFAKLPDALQTPGVAATVITVFLLNLLVIVGVFYLFAWLTYFAGRFVEGTGTARDVRSALAWGLVPIVCAILFRLPAALLLRGDDPQIQMSQFGVSFNTAPLARGCGWALVLLALEAIVFVAWIVITTNTLAEAHRYSRGRALQTLGMVAVAPIVIVIAAVLAFGK